MKVLGFIYRAAVITGIMPFVIIEKIIAILKK